MCDLFVKNDSWALIFHHDARKGFFANKKQALFSKNDDLFSVLNKVDDTFKIDDKFEFVLEYPEIEGYSQWTQTINPLNSKANETNGYQKIHFSWNQFESFDGLGLSFTPQSNLLDGSRFMITRFYAIGLYYQIGNTSVIPEDAIPGPFWRNEDVILHVVNLYIKIKDKSYLHKLYFICSLANIRNPYKISPLFYYVIISSFP